MMKLSKNLVIEKIDKSLIILDIISGEYFEANELGALIITEIRDGKSTKEIKRNLMKKFNVDNDTAQKDIEEFMIYLDEKGLLENCKE